MTKKIDQRDDMVQFYQLLFELSKSLNLARTPKEGLDSFADIVRKHLNINSLAVLVPDSEAGFEIIHQVKMSAGTLKRVTARIAEEYSRFLSGDQLDEAETREPLSYLLQFTERGSRKFFYLVPLVSHGKPQGLLVMVKGGGTSGNKKDPGYYYDLNVLSLLGNELAALIERAELMQKLEADKEQLRGLYRAGRRINSTFEESEILIQTLAAEDTPFRHDIGAFLETEDEYGAEVKLYSRATPSQTITRSVVAEILKIANKELSLSRKLKSREIRSSLHVSDARAKLPGSLNSFIACPVKIENRRTGLFYIASTGGHTYTPEHIYLFSTICYHAASAIENARAFKRNQKLAFSDPITGLYNHRYFQEALDRELERAMRYGSPLSLMILDIDHFKRFNDTYGHQQGDTVLGTLGGILGQHSRAVDTAARYGGEEFVLLLPETSRDGAMVRADRLRKEVAKHPLQLKGEDVTITVSIGVSNYPEDSVSSKKDLIEKADQALYRAKTEGRNRVCTYADVKTLDILEARPVF